LEQERAGQGFLRPLEVLPREEVECTTRPDRNASKAEWLALWQGLPIVLVSRLSLVGILCLDMTDHRDYTPRVTGRTCVRSDWADQLLYIEFDLPQTLAPCKKSAYRGVAEHTVKARNFGPHGNFGLFLASSV
jgi:hypothetical protein